MAQSRVGLMTRLCCIAVLILTTAGIVRADVIAAESDWTGFRATPGVDGVVGVSGWSVSNGGFRIAWDIDYLDASDPTKGFRYQYDISDENGGDLRKGLSHLILETSNPFSFIAHQQMSSLKVRRNSRIAATQTLACRTAASTV
jgi:hypothetical protein